METIISRRNPLVRVFRELAHGRPPSRGRGASERGHRLLLEGPHLVDEAISTGVRIETAAFASRLLERADGGRRPEIRRLANRLMNAGVRVVSASESVMAAMSPAETPSGLVAIARYDAPPLDRVFDRATEGEPLVLVVDDVQDPGNLGAMIRTAEAAGATGVVACGGSADPFGWKALRGAMGSSFRLPVARRPATREAVGAARARGLRILATDPRGSSPLHHARLEGPLAVLVGSEGSGLPADVLTLADERIAIPMRPPVESLNVAVAAGLVLYEAMRQRQGAGARD